jgi:hypothetical protein
MKKIFFCAMVMFMVLSVSAQTAGAQSDVEEATRELVSVYGLDENQSAEMFKIQERRLKNLAEIEPLRQSDYQLYLHKRRNVRLGTEGSIKRLLNEEQMEIFNRQLLERRKKESEYIKELRQKGAGKEEIQKAILEADY